MINEPPLSSLLPVSENMASWPKPWGNWISQAWRILFDISNSGTTAQRPTTVLYVSKFYFDTTLGLPIWYDGTQWIDAAGNAV